MDVLAAINGTSQIVGYVHISDVVREYGEPVVFNVVREIVTTVMDKYPTAIVTDHVKFYSEIFEMFCTISQGTSLDDFVADYMTAFSDDDVCEIDSYHIPHLYLSEADENLEIGFLIEIYNLILSDLKGITTGFTAMFKNVLKRAHGNNAKPIAFVNDGFGKLCLKYQLVSQPTILT